MMDMDDNGQMQVPPEPVISHYRQRVADLEYELVKTRIVLQQKNEQLDELVDLLRQHKRLEEEDA